MKASKTVNQQCWSFYAMLTFLSVICPAILPDRERLSNVLVIEILHVLGLYYTCVGLQELL